MRSADLAEQGIWPQGSLAAEEYAWDCTSTCSGRADSPLHAGRRGEGGRSTKLKATLSEMEGSFAIGSKRTKI